jgi:hypothetical protein
VGSKIVGADHFTAIIVAALSEIDAAVEVKNVSSTTRLIHLTGEVPTTAPPGGSQRWQLSVHDAGELITAAQSA